MPCFRRRHVTKEAGVEGGGGGGVWVTAVANKKNEKKI